MVCVCICTCICVYTSNRAVLMRLLVTYDRVYHMLCMVDGLLFLIMQLHTYMHALCWTSTLPLDRMKIKCDEFGEYLMKFVEEGDEREVIKVGR